MSVYKDWKRQLTRIIVPSKYESQVITVPHHVSGMGKIRATCAVYDLVAKGADKILLTGFCGSINGFKIGDIVSPDWVIERDYDVRPLEGFPNEIFINYPQKILMESQDKFVTNGFVSQFRKVACDMESYAFAYTCQKLGVKFYILKMVSDIVGSNSSSDFLKNCKKLGPKLTKEIKKFLKENE